MICENFALAENKVTHFCHKSLYFRSQYNNNLRNENPGGHGKHAREEYGEKHKVSTS